MVRTKKSSKFSAMPATGSGKTLSSKANGFLSQIKWGESYTSLFLGAVVVVVALILIFSFFNSKNQSRTQTGSASTVSQKQQVKTKLPKTYTVKEGDDLWSISEKIYGSGYNWVDLANANKLINPSVLYAGTKLNVPNVTPKKLTAVTQPKPISGGTYTVEKGDYLWEIAIRAYGNGYKWVGIARANHLADPNLIYSGNVLTLPR